ncbi:glycosyltransferase family 1 protein [Pedobacter chinensis]|uniref:Glycosyltransferase family 1 protein n=1 Tax=Pedobacter chinensis TaxID=2282421 RepID=A0A369PPS8_9SPHI|nr:glycosyltransferase [Pedobacter chinensis]RDC54290.1 glycosyltransferase family 1 protein [Pedobacter chinensis]
MNVLFYHRFLKRTDAASLPHHFFYGALDLDNFDVNVSFLEDASMGNRIVLAIKMAFKIIFFNQSHDLIYASTPYGLELLVLLKAICLFNKPIVVWQHRALRSSTNPFKKWLLKVYYSGFSKMIMFSDLHVQETLATGITKRDKLMQMHWGPDTNYFDKIIAETDNNAVPRYFCSTGRENRDFPTLIKGFENAPESILRIYTTKRHGNMNNEKLLLAYADKHKNVEVNIIENKPTLNKFLSKEVYKSQCAIISCHEHKYTVGLTSLLEAMALKKVVIISDNPYFPIDVEKQGIGIKVPYNDPNAWTKAINFIMQNPELASAMGEKARKFIDEECNADILSYNVAKCLYEVAGRKFSEPSILKVQNMVKA